MLTDDVFLEIFDFCRKEYYNYPYSRHPVWDWNILVHVCSRWRQIVFASPHRLDLQILCTYGTPVRKNLNLWPAFPIFLDLYSLRSHTPEDEENAITVLKHPDRVCSVRLCLTGSQFGRIATVMQEPFPILTRLYMSSRDGNAAILPANFLGGSAPRLKEIILSRIPYPGLPTLLLSAHDLVGLYLRRIPPTGYISPEAMVVCLAALPRLESFTIEFQLATSHFDQIHLPPIPRTVLPALTSFHFHGAYEYLEDFISQIDSPQLNWIFIDYLNRPVDLQVTQLSEFIDRSVAPGLTPSRRVHVSFHSDRVAFTLYRQANYPGLDRRHVEINITSKAFDWRVFDTSQVLSQFSAALSTVIHLELEVRFEEDYPLLGADDVVWLHLLRQFPAMQILHASREVARFVALALEHTTRETVSEVFPSLKLICLEGQPASSVEKFVAARQSSGCPVTVVNTRMELNEQLESYVRK